MEQVESNAKTRQEEGDTDAEHGPRPGQEQQQGVMDRGEEEGRERQDESEHHGGEPGVQRQRRQEERCHSLTCRRHLKTWIHGGALALKLSGVINSLPASQRWIFLSTYHTRIPLHTVVKCMFFVEPCGERRRCHDYGSRNKKSKDRFGVRKKVVETAVETHIEKGAGGRLQELTSFLHTCKWPQHEKI